jgi:hypothetical protein
VWYRGLWYLVKIIRLLMCSYFPHSSSRLGSFCCFVSYWWSWVLNSGPCSYYQVLYHLSHSTNFFPYLFATNMSFHVPLFIKDMTKLWSSVSSYCTILLHCIISSRNVFWFIYNFLCRPWYDLWSLEDLFEHVPSCLLIWNHLCFLLPGALPSWYKDMSFLTVHTHVC